MTTPAGTVLSQQPVDTAIAGARAWRIRYASLDVNGAAQESTGLVIAPTGDGDNRPILSWCHGTTGLGDVACPSALPDPARELITYFEAHSTEQVDYGVPGLQGFIDAGWVVCATDYQGLGTPGMHHYGVNVSNARDGLYIAHAARHLDVGAGTALGCAGWSQGGGASAAIAELDLGEFGDLRLVGTVAMSPGVGSILLNNPTGMTAALTDSSLPPDSHLVMGLAGVQAANPSTLSLSEVAPVNFDAWKSALVAGSAGNRKPVAPVLVCIDAFEGGTVIRVSWQTAYVDVVKGFGGTVEVREYPNDDHFSLPSNSVDDARAWLTALL